MPLATPLPFLMECTFPGTGRRGVDLVDEEFLDLVQPGDGDGVGQQAVGGRGADLDLVALPLDHRILLLFIHPAVNDGVGGAEFDFPDLAVPVHGMAAIDVGGVKLSLPLDFHPSKPELQGQMRFGPCDCINTKGATLETYFDAVQHLLPVLRAGCGSPE
ncbi:MAG: hypothetical protein WDM96_15835 [Lacunisphaera sp.]